MRQKNPVPPPASPPRADALAKATGAERYAFDEILNPKLRRRG